MSKWKRAILRYVRTVRCPVLVIHSPDDELVRFSHGRKVFAAAGQPKRFVELRGSRNTGFIESDDACRPALRRFLSECLPAGAETQP